ncbi:MAG: beta-lactamase family protein [Luteimonas sp.]|nr:beta-lactamase family protein [Luteimonas sp.]
MNASAVSLQRRQCLRIGWLAGLSLLAAPRLATATAGCPPRTGWVPMDDFLADLPRLMQALGVPGVGIAVVEAGAPSWSQVYGLADAAQGTPATDDTLFEVASLSKPVFAYLVLQLVDRGELDLDRPLVATLRPEYLGTHPWLARITARDVLRHSTGLPNWRKDPAHERLEPAAEPGTRIDYSGEAIFWLQRVVEAITGESLDATARRLLFEPAGMHDSTFAWDANVAARSVHGHRAPGDDTPGAPAQVLREQWNAALRVAQGNGSTLSDWRYGDAARALADVQAATPAGLVNWPGDIVANAAASLRCTVRDYARFMALMVRTQETSWELKPSTRQAMLSKQIDVPGRWNDKTLGWNVEATAQGPVFHHSGSNSGIFKNFALGDAARQRALVVLTNGANGALLYRRVVRAATGLDLLAFDV